MDTRPARLSYIVPAILRPNCATSSCHSSKAQAGDVVLETPESAYETLIGKTTAEGVNLVTPGSPNGSALKYLLRAEETVRMPPDQPLPDKDIELIEAWILDDARPN